MAETNRDDATIPMESFEPDENSATIEFVKPKIKFFQFTTKTLGIILYNHILCFDNCIFIVIGRDNNFSSLSVAMMQRNSTNVISSAIFSTDPDSRSESIAITLTKSLKTTIPIYVSFNVDIENLGLMDVTSALINYFRCHSEILNN